MKRGILTSVSLLPLLTVMACNSGPSDPALPWGTGEGELTAERGPTPATAKLDLRGFRLKIVSLWVSHGDATLLLLPTGEIALVDTGAPFAVREFLLPFLQRHGIRALDHLILTHYDGDHAGGTLKQGKQVFVGDPEDPEGVRIPVEHFWDYRSWHAGEWVELGGTRLFILNSAYENEAAGENDKSLSFRLECKGFSFTLGGDIYWDQQERILRDFPDQVRTHVYRTNHHLHGSVYKEYLIRSDPYLFITSAEYAAYQREAYTKSLQNAIGYLESQSGRLAESLLTVEDGDILLWARSGSQWGYAAIRPGLTIPGLGQALSRSGSLWAVIDPSRYRPRCSPQGLVKPGVFELWCPKAKGKASGSCERMELTSGEGFSCKKRPGTWSDDLYPLCQVACPDEPQSFWEGWGWCARASGFSCRPS